MRQIIATVSTHQNNLRSRGIEGLLDMFRYCGAYPYQQADVSLIMQAVENGSGEIVNFKVATLTDIRGGDIGEVGPTAFTPERWKSFGFTLDNYLE